MITTEEFLKLKKDKEAADRELVRAECELEEARKSLGKEFGLSSIKEAKQKLSDIEGEIERESKPIDKAVREFKERLNGRSEVS